MKQINQQADLSLVDLKPMTISNVKIINEEIKPDNKDLPLLNYTLKDYLTHRLLLH